MYPASERSILFEQMHCSQNWFTISHDGWHLPATFEKHVFWVRCPICEHMWRVYTPDKNIIEVIEYKK